MQGEVSVDDTNESHPGEMQSLGDHLSADEDIDFARAKVSQDSAKIIFAFERVGIHPFDARIGKKFREGFLNLLRAESGVANFWIAAFRIGTRRRHRFRVAANVTGQFLVLTMVGERDAAVRTT